VVTSPTGAVIRDILHRLAERFPRRVLLWPVLVQGEAAAEQIAAAIEGFNRLPTAAAANAPVRPDVIIVARGGGSLEDLWAFNEERVVRAARASAIPLISAVGHETDTTLIDLAADVRAPTPSAAAEMAVPVRLDLLARVHENGGRILGAMTRLLDDGRTRLDGMVRGLPDLARLSEAAAQRLDDWAERLNNGLGVGLDRRRAELARLAAMLPDLRQDIRHRWDRLAGLARSLAPAVGGQLRHHRARLGQAAALLESASYQRVLERGFALVGDAAGAPLRSIRAVAVGMDVALHFHDGDAGARVIRVSGGGGSAAPRKKKTAKPTPGDGGQGSLL
jgi:exodeoxyribonuclease VII large subunit